MTPHLEARSKGRSSEHINRIAVTDGLIDEEAQQSNMTVEETLCVMILLSYS